jgi:hypothetical protein
MLQPTRSPPHYRAGGEIPCVLTLVRPAGLCVMGDCATRGGPSNCNARGIFAARDRDSHGKPCIAAETFAQKDTGAFGCSSTARNSSGSRTESWLWTCRSFAVFLVTQRPPLGEAPRYGNASPSGSCFLNAAPRRRCQTWQQGSWHHRLPAYWLATSRLKKLPLWSVPMQAMMVWLLPTPD